MIRRRLETIALVAPGAFLCFLGWYHAGGRDGEFDVAYLLRDGDARLWALGGVFLLALGLWVHIRRFQAARRRSGGTPGAAIVPLALAVLVASPDPTHARSHLDADASSTVLVPSGEFHYGCDEALDPACHDDETPGRTMTLPAFRIDRTEVAVERYAACVEAGACRDDSVGTRGFAGRIDDDPDGRCNWGRPDRGDHPMNCIDWSDAAAYCAWAGGRLPTEVEWEKAARGTDGRRYPWGGDVDGDGPYRANLRDERHSWESDWMWTGFGDSETVFDAHPDGFAGTAPVGSFPTGASPFGALDMAGNVWEWTASPRADDGIDRVLRGGSYANGPRRARCSERFSHRPVARHDTWGFRCVYDVDTAEP